MSLRLGRYLSEVLVQALLRSCLVAILVVTLVEAPVYGSPSAALGVVLQAQNASVGSGVAAIGATLFKRDTPATGLRGGVRVDPSPADHRLKMGGRSPLRPSQTRGSEGKQL